MFGCAKYPETPKRAILGEVTNQQLQNGASPTANLKLLTSVALKEKERPSHRKDKSLQKLCDRFLQLYPLYGETNGTEIHLDSTAKLLGVERRRIYDIINILEALECATHCKKNTYSWHGATRLERLLSDLKRQGEMLGIKYVLKEGREIPSPKQRSLGLFAKRFLMMFLVEPPNTLINLEMAIRVLIIPHKFRNIDPSFQCDPQHKSKVRRLYDISNVLSSIGLIEKVSGPNILKKPVFRYKGLSAIINNVSTPQKCSFQLTPLSLSIKQTAKAHSLSSRSKRKLEFASPVSLPSSSVIQAPLTPSLSPKGNPYKWKVMLQVADMEYIRLNGASA